MKRCSECGSSFPDTDQFCELDGTLLIADSSSSNPVVSDRIEQETQELREIDFRYARGQLRQNWNTPAIVAVAAIAGVAIALVLFLILHEMRSEAPNQSSNEPSSNVDITRGQLPVPPSRPAPVESVSPSIEQSPSPNPTVSPAVQAKSAPVELSSSPVSTGDEKTRRGTVTIRLTNGTSVEADEVWETGEGIWYRQRGVVTLVQRAQVKAIEKASPAPSPSAPIPTSSAMPNSKPA